jgi:hypothetical protein
MSLPRLLLPSLLLLAAPAGAEIHGRYVETRTAAVFAGACHYQGEIVTRGRDAVVALDIESGREEGVDLAGVKAVIIVAAADNLAAADARRRSVLVVDEKAASAQVQALTRALSTRYAAATGDIVAVRRAPVRFVAAGDSYEVEAADYVALRVAGLPDRACCKMPNLVWYEPLFPLQQRRVGLTRSARSEGAGLFTPWTEAGENSSFYGSF